MGKNVILQIIKCEKHAFMHRVYHAEIHNLKFNDLLEEEEKKEQRKPADKFRFPKRLSYFNVRHRNAQVNYDFFTI